MASFGDLFKAIFDFGAYILDAYQGPVVVLMLAGATVFLLMYLDKLYGDDAAPSTSAGIPVAAPTSPKGKADQSSGNADSASGEEESSNTRGRKTTSRGKSPSRRKSVENKTAAGLTGQYWNGEEAPQAQPRRGRGRPSLGKKDE